jgi:Domain of unknown function (DUF5658)
MAASPEDFAPAGTPRGPDRRHRRSFRVVERRSGFDRRRDPSRSPVALALEAPIQRLREQPTLLAELLVMINLLSVIDLLITLSVLRMGAVELNPLMAWLIDLGTAPAAAAKIGVVLVATLGLWLLRRHRAALTTAVLLFAVYGSLVTFEIVGLLRLM